MFIDHAEIFVKAGEGGDGCNSFTKVKFQRYKGPDGGDGGKGGDIVIVSDNNVQTLLDFYYRKHFRGDSGYNGSSNHKKGADGTDCIIKVPVGTLVKDRDEDVTYFDFSKPYMRIVLAKGGTGGKRNSRDREATKGACGEEKNIILELKLVADVGIIGYPNVGKSSLLSRVSNARPKIANYPFTTKTPMLGMVRLDSERGFVICDIPGLIEGAHAGKGLGYQFLRHIERTRLLIHIIDMAGLEGREAVEDMESINNELKLYNPSLTGLPQVLVANKMDIPSALENFLHFKEKVRKKIYPISCATGEGIKVLLDAVYRKLRMLK